MKEPILSRPPTKEYRTGYDGINWGKNHQAPREIIWKVNGITYGLGKPLRVNCKKKKTRTTFKSVIALCKKLSK